MRWESRCPHQILREGIQGGGVSAASEGNTHAKIEKEDVCRDGVLVLWPGGVGKANLFLEQPIKETPCVLHGSREPDAYSTVAS